MGLDWLMNPEPRLDGMQPIDTLRSGVDPCQIIKAAVLFGEHGAA